MNFRDFVEVTRDALESLAFQLEGDRDVTPMLHLEAENRISISVISPSVFDQPNGVRVLLEGHVLPLIAENHARKVALTYCAWAAPNRGSPTSRPAEHPDRREILLATFIDTERVEHWHAPIVRTGGPVLIGQWVTSEPNLGGGPLITRLQEALR